MKKVKLYAMAFAALFFAASCQDDAIDPGQGQSNGEVESPAYLTIAFSANAGSSTRADREDTNTGDKDGNADDSGHHNAGESVESAVKTALVVVVPNDGETQGSYFAKLYSATAGAEGTPEADLGNTEKDDAALTVINDQTKTYSTDAPIEIAATSTGIEYKVLVVVNPISSLTSSISAIRDGVTDETSVQGLYNTITTGQFQDSEANNTYITAASKIADTNENGTGFMMANREERITKVTTENTPDDPAVAELDVERVISKITFRPNMSGEDDAQTPSYIYTVKSSIGGTTFKAETEDGAYDPNDTGVTEGDGETETTEYSAGVFNKAEDLAGNEVWVLYDADNKFVGVYGQTEETVSDGDLNGKTIYQRLTPKTKDEYGAIEEKDQSKYYVATKTEDVYDEANSFTLQLKEETVTGKTFYAKLEGYALVNLSKKVNYVRHRIPVGGVVEEPFGLLGATNNYYLWTPDWTAKNSATFKENETSGIEEIQEGNNGSDWFYNTLRQVSDESKTLTVSSGSVSFDGKSYFKAISSITADGEQDVTQDGNITASQHTSDLADIGYKLGYCFENSVEQDMQKHGLTTGIAFVATMWEDANCTTTPLNRLYRYSGYVFESISQIVTAYAGNVDEKIKILAEKETAGTAFDSSDLVTMDELGIDRYEGNICYYYSTEIKHLDDGNKNSMGVMEFAIMRNNIYSLSISGINDIGEPFIDPTPSPDNESTMSALRIEAKILPWIVRYNDIEF